MKKIKNAIKGFLHYDNSFFQKAVSTYMKKKRNKRNSKLLKEYGHYMLNSVFQSAKKFDIPVWIEFGTLLGAYRDKSFISHDYDIDLGMYQSNYSSEFEDELLSYGFVKIRSFYIKDVISGIERKTEITYDYKGIQLDIFLNYVDNDERNMIGYRLYDMEHLKKHQFRVFKSINPPIKGFIELQIDSHSYCAPLNTEEVLKTYYGDSFMTPTKTYSSNQDGSKYPFYPIDKKVGIMKGFFNKEFERRYSIKRNE